MHRLKRSLKIYRWWDSHLPLMLAMVYLELSPAHPLPSAGAALLTLILFLTASIGIAGFGYLLNDLMDVEPDRRSGVSNMVAAHSRRRTVIRFGVVLLLSWLPWLWLPLSKPILALLACEYALFILYSVPPFRFKERGILGPAADALYGYAIPMLVSLLVFARFGYVVVPPLFYPLVGGWAFIMGLRHILIHQLEDVANDEVAGARTFVTMHGWRTAFNLMERRLFPLEAALFTLFLIIVGMRLPLVPLGFGIYLIWILRRQSHRGIQQVGNPWKLPAIDRLLMLNILIMSRFQTQWLPLLILLPLTLRSPFYLVFVLIQLLCFENGLKTLFVYELPELRRMRQTA